MYKKIVFTLVFALAFFASFSQNKMVIPKTNEKDEPKKTEKKVFKEFSADTAKFAKEVRDFFEDVAVDDAKKAMYNFVDRWKSGKFTADEQPVIVGFCNKMLKGKMRPYPDFQSYFNTLGVIKDKGITPEIFTAYHDVGGQVMEKNKKDYRELNEIMVKLFTDGVIADNGGKSWKVNSKDYKLIYQKEPLIIFEKTDLQLFTRNDTLSIYNTSGVFSVNNNKWKGKGGDVFWTRVGFPKEKVNVKLKKYNFDLRTSDFSSDSAELTYPALFQKPILGRYTDKVTATYQGEKANYPRFSSYQSVFKLNNVFQNINFYGGFSLEGGQIIGKSADSTRATVTIFSQGKLRVRAYARSFVIDKDKLVSSKATASFYLGDKDSIYQPQCIFNYNEKTRRLTLARKDEGIYASPFFDTYHQLEFSPDNLIWDIDSMKANLRSISNVPKDIPFESSNFFNVNKMLQLQGVLDYNPITKLKNFFDKNGNSASMDAVAAYFGNTADNLLALMILLSRDGFIFYDMDGKTVTQKSKLQHYEMSANKGEDYDVIKFISNLSGRPNGILDMNTNELTVLGVERIMLSDSQESWIIPKDKTVTIRKNRDMLFNGKIHSGRFDFWGKGMHFDYDSFKIDLLNIDSVKFKFPEFDTKGNIVAMHDVQTVIQNVTGYLYIDKFNNKSGKKELKDYPIFNCTKESYVYYDRKSTWNGVYPRDRFFFKIDPFIIKNLDHFTADSLQFPGTFISADILPDIKYALTIQEDYSLGFIKDAPEIGYPLYKGKGQGFGKYYLSNRGLRGDGRTDYLISHTSSTKMWFFPDSMNTDASLFEIPDIAGSKYPPVNGKDVYDHWLPYKDSMFVYKRKEPIQIYKDKVIFTGSFVLTPIELIGNGVTNYQNITLASTKFSFLPDKIKTDEGNLTIKADNSTRPALEAKDVTATIDLTKDFAKFNTNKDTAKVKLSSQLFSTTLNNFTYDVKEKEIDFERSAAQNETDAYFISDHPTQEKLQFTSAKARYKIDSLNLKAFEVPALIIADSRITTPDNSLTVQKDAVIKTITNAEIITSNENKYHRIHHALVNIFGKNKFSGYGTYNYIDKNGDSIYIYFNDIHTTEEKTTMAQGIVRDTQHFHIWPKVLFKGNVDLTSNEKNLWFHGYINPDHQFPQLRTAWVRMSDTIDSKNVIFDFPKAIGEDGKELYTGIFMTNDSTYQKIYTVFLGKKINPDDIPVFISSGLFMYDEKKQIFILGERKKLSPPANEVPIFAGGNTFQLIVPESKIYAEGKFDFGSKFGKTVEISTGGNYKEDLVARKHNFNLSIICNFPWNDDITKMMSDNVLLTSYTLKEISDISPSTYNAFALMMNVKKDREKVINELSTYKYIASADVVNKMLVFSSVNMQYNDSAHGFFSEGPIGLATIKKVPVNKNLTGMIAIKTSGEERTFGVLMETLNDNYHYFKFYNDKLYYLGNDMNYVDKIKDMQGKLEKGSKGSFKLRQETVDGVLQFKKKDLDMTFRKDTEE